MWGLETLGPQEAKRLKGKRSSEGERERMVQISPRLAIDVDMAEETELQRLEGREDDSMAAGLGVGSGLGVGGYGVVAVGGDHGGTLAVAAKDSAGLSGVVVQGAAQRRDQLESKAFNKVGFRDR